MNHPVGVVPSRRVSIPADWPLAADGTINCSTCHRSVPSVGGPNGPMLRDGTSYDARVMDVRGFCARCHAGNDDRTGAGMHWLGTSRAHIALEGGLQGAARRLDESDAASCLGCHDGVTARDATYETRWNRGAGDLGDRSRNHPIGVPYPHAGTRGVEVPLRPAALLPAAVRLIDEKVTCLSCHNLYAQDPQRLSIPVEGSRLCLTCHQME